LHPETIQRKKSEEEYWSSARACRVGSCAALGQRGYRVVLIEGRREPGGRVPLESALPGLANGGAWLTGV